MALSPITPLSDRFVEIVLELAPDGIAVTDESGRFVHANGCFERLFGYAREELMGHRVEMLMPEAMRSAHRGHRHDFDDEPAARPMGTGLDLWGLHADGTTFPIEVGLSPVSTLDGGRTIMAVRAASARRTSDDEAAGDRAVYADRDRMALAFNDGVIEPIFAASLMLHGLLDTASGSQLAVLHPAIGKLDDAIQELRRVLFARDQSDGSA